jgi:hypothetical protein
MIVKKGGLSGLFVKGRKAVGTQSWPQVQRGSQTTNAMALKYGAKSIVYTYQVVAQSGGVLGGIPLTNLVSPFISNDETVLFLGDYPAGNSQGALFSTNFGSAKQSVSA